MKTISAGMRTHLDLQVTSLANCVAIRRKDGQTFFFTDHDQDIDLSTAAPFTLSRHTWLNTNYRSDTGFLRTATASNASAVDNSEIEGILHDEGVTAADVNAGRFDDAECYLFVVNWNNLTNGVIRMPGSGRVGEIELRPRGGAYKMELRGLAQLLKTTIGEVYSPTCRVDVFSRRCRLDETKGRNDSAIFTSADLTFDQVAAANDTVTRATGDWIDDGFKAGMEVTFSGTVSNNVTAVIAAISASGSGDGTSDVLEFSGDVFTDEGPVTGASVVQEQAGGSQQHGALTAVSSRAIFTSAITPATFNDQALTITNQGFESGAQVGDAITGWTEGEVQAAGMWETGAFTPTPPEGSNSLGLDNQQPHDVNRVFDIYSDLITFSLGGGGEPTTSDVDSGLVCVDVTAQIRLGTTSGGETLDEAAIGVRFEDGAGTQVSEAKCTLINPINHGLVNSAWTTYTRRFIVPSGARDMRIVLYAKNVLNSDKSTKCDVYFDNITATLTPTPSLFRGQDRDYTTLDDWFDGGLIVFRSGENEGVAREIKSYDYMTGIISLFFPLPVIPSVNDVFEIYAGCKHRWQMDCAQKWNNGINMQAEPFVPSQDEVFATLDVPRTEVTVENR